MRESVAVLDAYRPTQLAPLPFSTENFAGNLALSPTAPDFTPATQEKYAHSLSAYRKVGELATASCLEAPEEEDLLAILCSTPEGEATANMLRCDLDRALGEMLNTDSEFREELDIDLMDKYAIKNDKVVMENGEPVVDMIERGYEASKEAAKEEPKLLVQAMRDGMDKKNAVAVDAMKPKRLRVPVTMDPKAAMKRDGEEFWAGKLGYRFGLAFEQWYFKPDENTLYAGSLSVKDSDKKTWSELYAEHNVEIPVDTPDEEWLGYAIEIDCETVEEAHQFVANMRKDYYRRRGIGGRKHSVTEFVDVHQKPLIDQIFKEMVMPLAIATHTGQKNEAMHTLADALLQNSGAMKADIRHELIRICNTDTFDDRAARVMEFMIRYGAVESMRQKLPDLLREQTGRIPQRLAGSDYAPMLDHRVAMVFASNVAAGAAAGRTYGGCAAGFDITNKRSETAPDSADSVPDRNAQEAFGGIASKDTPKDNMDRKNWKKKKGPCVVPSCPNRKKTVTVGPCGVCMDRCQRMYDKGQDPTSK